jgi:hypothetical protein
MKRAQRQFPRWRAARTLAPPDVEDNPASSGLASPNSPNDLAADGKVSSTGARFNEHHEVGTA